MNSILSPKSNVEIENDLDKLSNVDKFSTVLKFRLNTYIEHNRWGQSIEGCIKIIREVAYKYNIIVKIKNETSTDIEIIYNEEGHFMPHVITILLNA